MAWIEPLNMEQWLVNTFSGTPEIFMFISFIVIAALAAYFKMPNFVTMIMFVIFGIMMAGYFPAVYVLILIFTGLITFYSISKIVK